MLIDRSHRPWAVVTGAFLVVALVLYVPYASRAEAPSGGSIPGLAYGIAGFGMMLFAGLLGARKKVPVWRLGRAQSWMRGHLWLGTLGLPLIFFHAGLTFGGGLTLVLMWLFVVVVASGLFGAWLQHTVPRRMTRELPMETIYEQIDHVREQLVNEGDTIVAEACGKLEIETIAPTALAASAGSDRVVGADRDPAGAAALASTVRIDAEDSAPLREFYMREMRAFLLQPSLSHALADPATATLKFDTVRALVPPLFQGPIADLENICEEERQLMRQSRMHAVLHGWLLVHVPLSIALLLMAFVHIFVALRY